MVRVAGFEPAAFRSQGDRSTKLSYTQLKRWKSPHRLTHCCINPAASCNISILPLFLLAKALGFEPRLAVLETAVLAVKHYTNMG